LENAIVKVQALKTQIRTASFKEKQPVYHIFSAKFSKD